MVEYAYKNGKNTSTGYTFFGLNCGFHPRVSYKEDVDPRFKWKTTDQLATELYTLISMCRENLKAGQLETASWTILGRGEYSA